MCFLLVERQIVSRIDLHIKFEAIVGQVHMREAHSNEAFIRCGVGQVMGDVREPGAARPEFLHQFKSSCHRLVHGVRLVAQRVDHQIVQVHQQIVGLLVDAVSDILMTSEASMQPTPDVASEMAKSFVKGVYAVDGRMISIVTLECVLPVAAKAAAASLNSPAR